MSANSSIISVISSGIIPFTNISSATTNNSWYSSVNLENLLCIFFPKRLFIFANNLFSLKLNTGLFSSFSSNSSTNVLQSILPNRPSGNLTTAHLSGTLIIVPFSVMKEYKPGFLGISIVPPPVKSISLSTLSRVTGTALTSNNLRQYKYPAFSFGSFKSARISFGIFSAPFSYSTKNVAPRKIFCSRICSTARNLIP